MAARPQPAQTPGGDAGAGAPPSVWGRLLLSEACLPSGLVLASERGTELEEPWAEAARGGVAVCLAVGGAEMGGLASQTCLGLAAFSPDSGSP